MPVIINDCRFCKNHARIEIKNRLRILKQTGEFMGSVRIYCRDCENSTWVADSLDAAVLDWNLHNRPEPAEDEPAH